MKEAVIILLLTISALKAAAKEDVCQDWFHRSGLSTKTPDCVLRCDILPKDMSTFACAERCDEFCKPRKCQPDLYWKNKIKMGKPSQWDIPGEVAGEWTEPEKQKLLELLSRLPDELKSVPFEASTE